MPATATSVKQVPRLTTDQIAEFKREGFLILPGVLDLELCRRAHDLMWETTAEYLPRLKRDDPTTWGPFTKEEAERLPRTRGGPDAHFFGSEGGHGLFIRNGAEELMLDLAPRALWDVAEQLLGKGELVWPAGLDESGFTVGPCLINEDAVNNLKSHLGSESGDWPEQGTGKTIELRLPKSGPHWLNGQGSRGMYCRLPNSPSPGPDWKGAHAGEGLYNGQWGLQIAAYYHDLPPLSGGLTLWPRSHTRIWDHWEPINTAVRPNGDSEPTAKFSGYSDPPIPDIKADTSPCVTHGPAGSVVLWHANMLHMAGQNQSSDVIRQATIYNYLKTPEALSDERALANPSGGQWDLWSDEVRAVAV